jgi:hypothetical protein
MAVSDVNTAMAAAVVALRAGDFATAVTEAHIAQGYLSILPDSVSGGRDGFEMRWDSKKIEDFIGNVRRSQGESQGMQQSVVRYARAGA